MNKRGLIIFVFGLILVIVSFSIAVSVIPSGVSESNNLPMSILFEEMFDEVSDEVLIMPGDSTFVSYDTLSSNVSLLWGMQILDYQSDDRISIIISNIFGDDYGKFVQNDPIMFELLEISQSDTLNFEIKNLGSRHVTILIMFSEDPKNSNVFSNSNSSAMKMIFPLAISGVMILLGIVVSIIGIFVFLIDLKNYQNNKRDY
jgi:hypothetical protein